MAAIGRPGDSFPENFTDAESERMIRAIYPEAMAEELLHLPASGWSIVRYSLEDPTTRAMIAVSPGFTEEYLRRRPQDAAAVARIRAEPDAVLRDVRRLICGTE